MTKTIGFMLAGLTAFGLMGSAAEADEYVNGYYRRDGTYVQGHYRTESNDTRNDNYSTRGNINPYTGSYGTKPRDEDRGLYHYGR